MVNSEQFLNQKISILGNNSHLKGEFEFTGNVRINSFMEGKLTIKDQGELVIEEFGNFKGTIICNCMVIHGQFDGEIHATGRVIIEPSAEVTGSIHAKSLTVFPGAILNITGNTLD